LAPDDRFQVEGDVNKDVPDGDLKEDIWDHCATKWGNNLQGLAVQAMTWSHLRCGQRLACRSHGVRGLPGPQMRGTWDTRSAEFDKLEGEDEPVGLGNDSGSISGGYALQCLHK
jgi:hypothetical protein